MTLPIGYIAPVANPPIPDFLECDGRRLWRVDYPELFNVIGVYYGGANTPAMFNLPDMRGQVHTNHGLIKISKKDFDVTYPQDMKYFIKVK